MSQTQSQTTQSNREVLQVIAGYIRGINQKTIAETLNISLLNCEKIVSKYRFRQIFRGNLKSETNNVNVIMEKENNHILGYLYGMEPAISYEDLTTILENHDFTKSMIAQIQSEITETQKAPLINKSLTKKEPVHVASSSTIHVHNVNEVSDNEIIEALKTQRPNDVSKSLNIDLTRVYRVRFVFQQTQSPLMSVVNPRKSPAQSRYVRPIQKKPFVYDGTSYQNREDFIGKNYPKFNFTQLAQITGLSWHSVRVYHQKYLRNRRTNNHQINEFGKVVALGHEFPNIKSAIAYLAPRLTLKATATELHIPIEKVRQIRSQIAQKTGEHLPLIKRNRNSENVESIGHITVDDVVYKTTREACIALGFTWYSVEELAERLHLKIKTVHDNVIRAKRKSTIVIAIDGHKFDDCFVAIKSLIGVMTLPEMAHYLKTTPTTIINRYRKYNATHDQALPLFKRIESEG